MVPLEVGDRVYLNTDPRKDEGTVVEVMHNRYFVQWDNGRTWIYPRSWLSLVEEAVVAA